MDFGHAEAANGVTLEIEFDQHHRLIANDPPIMSRLDRHDLWSLVFHDAPVCVLDVDFAPRQEADVGVHAQVGSDNRFHVDRPAESGRVDHALDACGAGAAHLEPDVTDLAAFGSLHGSHERVRWRRSCPPGAAAFRGRGPLPDVLPRDFLLRHALTSLADRMLAPRVDVLYPTRTTMREGDQMNTVDRRTFLATITAGAAAAGTVPRTTAADGSDALRDAAQSPNVVAGLADPQFRPLRVGAIRPAGWLARQLRIQAGAERAPASRSSRG
jgi:hypothetical protein